MAKDYNGRRDANPSQISKKYGKNVFIEVIQPNDNFERVTVNLVSLNPNNTQKCMISCYVDMDEWVMLCNRIVQGRFGQRIEIGKQVAQQSNSFPEAVWQKQGGKEGANGAWMLSIHPATKSGDVMVKAQRGFGEKMDNGLIKLKYSPNNDQVLVSLTHEILEDIANMSLMRIQAYIISRQLRGLYDYTPRTNKGEPEYNQPAFTEQSVAPVGPVDFV